MDPALPSERRRTKEKVLGRYPELSLKDAREQAQKDRSQIERGIDVAVVEQVEKVLLLKVLTIERLGEAWVAHHILPATSTPTRWRACWRSASIR